MIARQPICVLDDALLADIHKDPLPTHGAHTVGEVFGRHARLAVELEEKNRSKRRERRENQPKQDRGLRSSEEEAKREGEGPQLENIFYMPDRPHLCWVDGEKRTDQSWAGESDLTEPERRAGQHQGQGDREAEGLRAGDRALPACASIGDGQHLFSKIQNRPISGAMGVW